MHTDDERCMLQPGPEIPKQIKEQLNYVSEYFLGMSGEACTCHQVSQGYIMHPEDVVCIRGMPGARCSWELRSILTLGS